jgi:ATP-dependent helicase/DNAse subunit B
MIVVRDKFSALWISNSSLNDYLKCPRAYYLNHVYRDPKTNHKITLMQPPLALGQIIHEVIESLSLQPAEQRFQNSLIPIFEKKWHSVQGKSGGFVSSEQEAQYKERGVRMLENIMEHPGPLRNKAIKIRKDLPYFWLSEEENIILCGKIDWLEYLPETNSLHIIDFKTGKFDEDPDSLQLPIYCMLVEQEQKRTVSKVSYWYLNRDPAPYTVPLPHMEEAKGALMEIAKKIQLARKLDHFKCAQKDGCSSCRPLELIVAGKAERIGVNEYNNDVYIIRNN